MVAYKKRSGSEGKVFTAVEVQNMKENVRGFQSLDESLKGCDEGSRVDDMYDVYRDLQAVNLEEIVEDGILLQEIEGACSRLTKLELEIIRLRYGFVDGIYHTQKRVGEKLGLTEYSVRKFERKAKEKLREAVVEEGE